MFLQPPLYTVPFLYKEDDFAPRLHIFIDGHRLRALVDTGAQSTMIYRGAARSLGLSQHDVAHDRHHKMHGLGPNEVDSTEHVFHAVSVGNLTFRNMPVAIADADATDEVDVLLGADFQRKTHLWISNATHALVMQYPPLPSPPISNMPN